MMQLRMAFPVDGAHRTQEELQAIHMQRHHTHITNLAELQNRTHLTNSLPSGGQSVSMSKPQILKYTLLMIASAGIQTNALMLSPMPHAETVVTRRAALNQCTRS